MDSEEIKKRKGLLLFFSVAIFAAIAYLALLGKMRAVNIFVDLFGFAGLFFGALVLDRIVGGKGRMKLVTGVLIILVVGSFFASGYLGALREGTKIDAEAAAFAFAFREFDPELKQVVFLTESIPGKIAEYSNKIPLDKRSGFFLPISPALVSVNDAYQKELDNRELRNRIMEDHSLLKDVDFDYVVIDSGTLEGMKLVFEYGKFRVYENGD